VDHGRYPAGRRRLETIGIVQRAADDVKSNPEALNPGRDPAKHPDVHRIGHKSND